MSNDLDDLHDLIENNRRWAQAMKAREPGFFTRLAQQQNPRYMWIGCADSRVPALSTPRSGPARPAPGGG
jgi:carbonic anhydrase